MDLDWLLLTPWPWRVVGIAGIVAGLLVLFLGVRRVWIRVLAVFAIMVGFGLISPWLLLVSVPPALIVVNRRRRRLHEPRLMSAVRGGDPGAELAEWIAEYAEAGFRHAGTLHVQLAAESFVLAIHRLPDLCGWIELTPTSLEIQHRFDRHHVSTVDFRALPRPRRHLLQLCASPDLDPRLTAHRRLLARLARMGHRPDRLGDDEVIAIVLNQIETAYREMAKASWWDALVFTYWEERALQGQFGCRPLVDHRRAERRLTDWLAE